MSTCLSNDSSRSRTHDRTQALFFTANRERNSPRHIVVRAAGRQVRYTYRTMKRSDSRILTTHAGRLDGPSELIQLSRDVMSGRVADVSALRPTVQRGIVDVIRRQAGAGVDVVSDGEVGKFGFGSLAYYGRRLSGLTTRPLKPGEAPYMALETNERIEFAEFYRELQFGPFPPERTICNGPINYIGHEEVQKDIERFKSAVAEANVTAEETFMCVLAPGWLEHFFYNEYYSTEDESHFAT